MIRETAMIRPRIAPYRTGVSMNHRRFLLDLLALVLLCG